MSLRWYQRPRLVVLNPRTPVLEAGRAIENNNIGAVVVADRGEVVGIVTDRDLAVRVVGRGLDPTATLVADVMTTSVAVLSPRDSQHDAVRLMQERNVRRIPLVEGKRLVGMVTLDDLLLDEAAPLDELAHVVATQIGEGGPADAARSPADARRTARAYATYRRLVNQLREHADLKSAAEAEVALEIVLQALIRRLTPQEAKDLIAQLPSLMHPALSALPPGPDKRISRQVIEAELVQRVNVHPTRAAQLMASVWDTIAESVSAGQMQDVQRQLPQELRDVFSEASLKS